MSERTVWLTIPEVYWMPAGLLAGIILGLLFVAVGKVARSIANLWTQITR